MNPFGINRDVRGPETAGVMQVAAPAAPQVSQGPTVAEAMEGKLINAGTDAAIGLVEDTVPKAATLGAEALKAAPSAAGKGASAATGAASGTGLMAGATAAAPVLLGGLVLSKLFK